jgi:hypothetical protein
MRKNPDTVGTLLVAAVALGGGYLAYRLLTDGKGKQVTNAEKSARPVANLVTASAAPVVAAPAPAPAPSASVPTQAQAWSALVAASKGGPLDVSEQQFGTLLWPTLADAEKRMLLDFFVAMGSPNAETAVPAVMGRPGFDAVMAKMMQAQSAALPKGTSGFGDYHHGAY